MKIKWNLLLVIVNAWNVEHGSVTSKNYEDIHREHIQCNMEFNSECVEFAKYAGL